MSFAGNHESGSKIKLSTEYFLSLVENNIENDKNRSSINGRIFGLDYEYSCVMVSKPMIDANIHRCTFQKKTV